MKFALRCGIGDSMRSLRGQIGRHSRLLTDTGPDDVMHSLQSGAGGSGGTRIAGFHVFRSGGLRKAASWLRTATARLPVQPPHASATDSQNP